MYSKIILVTNWRSGGAFISNIIGAYPATILHPQPLKVLLGMSKIASNSHKLNESMAYLTSLLKCDFSFVKKKNGSYSWRGLPFFATNVPTWRHKCGRHCSHPQFLEKFCKLFPVHVFKEDRLDLEVVQPLLEDPELASYLKIVYLARDPRAVYSSRQQIGWCKKAPICSNGGTLCQTLVQDYHSAISLQAQFPNRIK